MLRCETGRLRNEGNVSLRIRVTNATQQQEFAHAGGPLEFGRGPPRQAPRCLIDDPAVSRDQLRIEELPDGRLRVENLSLRTPVAVSDGTVIPVSQVRDLETPVRLGIGNTTLVIEPVTGAIVPSSPGPGPSARAPTAPTTETVADRARLQSLVAISPPVRGRRRQRRPRSCEASSAAADLDYLTGWLETVIELQQAAAGSPEFYGHIAEALVDLVGLDLGLVLLRQGDGWTIVGSAVTDAHVCVRYSRTLLEHVVAQRQTFYQDLHQLRTDSLADIEVAVVAPMFGLQDDVVGVLYGVRSHRAMLAHGNIDPLEAQLVQLLAAAGGANLARSLAVRTRVQFEQFFSPDLVRELERDPHLLEGRREEVTILCSDLRHFTALSQRLGAQRACRLVRDMMECLSEPIIQYGGVIVDYAGDGILAMWNAPAKQADHAARACRAALAMQGEMASLNARWQAEVGSPLALGIGLNTGEAQVGNTGSSRKFKYGPHGHTVNLASRVQDTTKSLALPLLITGPTRAQLPPEFHARRLGQVALPGVTEPVMLHELHGEQASPEWLAARDTYEKALALYEVGQWSRACQTLMPLVVAAECQGCYDTPTLKLMRRAWLCLETRPDPFQPVIDIGTK